MWRSAGRKEITNFGAECAKLQHEFGVGIAACVAAYTLLGALRAYPLLPAGAVQRGGARRQVVALRLVRARRLGLQILSTTSTYGLIDDNRRALDDPLRLRRGVRRPRAARSRTSAAG